MNRKLRYVVGIDEAGRGPLAGPVAMGIFVAPLHFDFSLWGEIRDSKKLTHEVREDWYRLLLQAKGSETVRFLCRFASASQIDRLGIVPSCRNAIRHGLLTLDIEPSSATILLDGALHAPSEYADQKTIVRGDETEPAIALASIVAKVSRDRLMVRLAKRYPEYGFEKHKGYGTLAHQNAIREHGLCPIHRRSFISSNIHKKIAPSR